MKNYLAQNSKMKKSGAVNFGIPAFRSKEGFKTCPKAGQCAKGCYAMQKTYTWPQVKAAYEKRLALTRSPEFVETIDKEIKRRKIKKVRVHDSGDFYSKEYLTNWLLIASYNPDTLFYAYTKQVRMVKGTSLPPNFKIIFSFGGKEDKLIDMSQDRHSRVFANESQLKVFGYANASVNDDVALGDNPRIGLIYHGAKAKQWGESA